MTTKTETQIRLERAAGYLSMAREHAANLRRELAAAEREVQKAKEKWEFLFEKDQNERCARKMNDFTGI